MKVFGLSTNEKLDALRKIEEHLEPFTALYTVAVILLEAAQLIRHALEHFVEGSKIPLELFHLLYALCVGSYFFVRWKLVVKSPDLADLGDLDDAQIVQAPQRMRFALPEDMDTVVRLNREAFKGTLFDSETDAIEKRDKSYRSKNTQVFYLALNPKSDVDEIIGYTCLLPLTDNGAVLYRQGYLKDSLLPAELICNQGQTPAVVLLFAVVIAPDHRGVLNAAHLLSTLRQHCRFIYNEFGGPTPPLWVQVEREHSLKRIFRHFGFTNHNPYKTADGCRLWELKDPSQSLLNPAFPLLPGKQN